MVIIVCVESLVPGMRLFADMANHSGHPTVIWNDNLELLPNARLEPVPKECVSVVQRFFDLKHESYGSLDHLEACCNTHYNAYLQRMDGLTTPKEQVILVVWGSVSLVSRCAIYAAKTAGIGTILCVESPLLPEQKPRTSWIVTLDATYYEYNKNHENPLLRYFPIGFGDPIADIPAMEEYRQWWLTNKQTKPYHRERVTDDEFCIPEELQPSNPYRVVTFGQIYYDAARMFQVEQGDLDLMIEASRTAGAVYKPHPLIDESSPPGLTVVPNGLSIHSVLKHANCTLTINSNVGLETFMYGLPVVAFSDAIYRGPGLTAPPSLDVSDWYDPLHCDYNSRMIWLSVLRQRHHVHVEDNLDAAIDRLIEGREIANAPS